MADSLTDAVIQAVVFSDGLVRDCDSWPGPDCPDALRDHLEALDHSIRASNSLVERAAEFRGLYPTIPEPVAGVSDATYHELGRTLAMKVFEGIVSAAWYAQPKAFPLPSESPLEPKDYDAILRQWPAIRKYLRDVALRFDSSRLVAQIRDERAKAATRTQREPQSAKTASVVVQADELAVSKEAMALAVLKDHPEWSDTQIAQAAGCNRTTLYTWSSYTRARAILADGKTSRPHGSKSKDGRIEAWTDGNNE